MSIVTSMTMAEQQLIADTTASAIADLSEDDLLDLHSRIRRARNKYVGIYRRQAGGRVPRLASRGVAHEQGQRDRSKAEAFETALARVSRRIAVVARQAAAELRADRLAAARTERPAPKPTKKAAAASKRTADSGRARVHRKTTGGVKKDASTKAQGVRRQARRDAKG